MTEEKKRVLITVARRVVFTGLIILGAWLLLTVLRTAIPANAIEAMAEQREVSVEEMEEFIAESDWSVSFWADKPVKEIIGERIGYTARLLVFSGLLSLGMAALLLFLGALISRVTERPAWLVKVRQVLRLVIISGGVTRPVFFMGTVFVILSQRWFGWSSSEIQAAIPWWSVFIVSVLPAWLLVQAGHGELARINGSNLMKMRHLSVRLVTTLLKLVGAIIAITMLTFNGLGRLLYASVVSRDFPVLVGAAWVFVLIIVLAKLAAELIEIAYNYFGRQPVIPEQSNSTASKGSTIPKGWFVFSLVLVLVVFIGGWVAPLVAPYPANEIHLADRLQPSSAEHILGTDHLGKDLFSQLLYSVRTQLRLSLTAVGIMVLVAAGWAILAAYVKKANSWVGDTLEDVVMLPRDIFCAFPWPLLILVPMTFFGRGNIQVAVVVGLALLPHAVGMMKETVNSPPEGQSWLYSVLWSIPVMFLFAMAGATLYIATASYLGYGVAPGTPELGSMLSSEGRKYMMDAPWLSVWFSLTLLLFMMVWVMAGDALLERLGFRSKAVWLKVVE